jgi:mono/diheme cytochrome c family protein
MRRPLTFAAVALACTALACDWPWLHDMANQPSRPAGAGPRSPAPGAMPIDAEPVLTREAAESRLRNPIAASAPVDRGRRLYSVYCAPCHGMSGKGDGAVAQRFAPAMGDLTGDNVQDRGDGWIYGTIADGTDTMPRYAHELDAAERWEIVHFVRTMRKQR